MLYGLLCPEKMVQFTARGHITAAPNTLRASEKTLIEITYNSYIISTDHILDLPEKYL